MSSAPPADATQREAPHARIERPICSEPSSTRSCSAGSFAGPGERGDCRNVGGDSAGSTRIIRGHVALIEAVQDEASGIISTLVDMEVTEVLKGDPKVKTLRLKHLGGTVGGLTLEVPGSAHFTVGEDTLLFLEPARDPEIWLVRSMAAGKVNLRRRTDGQMQAHRHLDGLGSRTNERWLDSVADWRFGRRRSVLRQNQGCGGFDETAAGRSSRFDCLFRSSGLLGLHLAQAVPSCRVRGCGLSRQCGRHLTQWRDALQSRNHAGRSS